MASINATNLPAFFQSASKTVIDELADFELGGALDDDCPLDEEEEEEEEGLQSALREEEDDDPLTFDEDTFGDLNVTDLPDFFTQSAHLEPRGDRECESIMMMMMMMMVVSVIISSRL